MGKKSRAKSKLKARTKKKQKAVKKAKKLIKRKVAKKKSLSVTKKQVKRAVKKAKKAVKKAKKVERSRVAKKKKIVTKQAKPLPKRSGSLAAIAQINTVVGDLTINSKKIIASILKAREAGAQLIVFPELTVTGSSPKDLLLRPDFVDVNMRKFIEIVGACRGIICVVGFVNKVNGALHNAVALIKDQKILGIYNKRHLSRDELRYFTPGGAAEVIQAGSLRLGLTVCHDLSEEQTTINSLAEKGIDLLLVSAASPYTIGKPLHREQQAVVLAKRYRVPILFTNAIGAQDDTIYDGSSFFMDKKGKVVGRAKRFAEDILLVDLKAAGGDYTPAANQAAEVYQAITLGIRDYFAKTGHTKAIIGISGGLDSAVAVTLAVHALGAENVTALLLPTKMTSKESVQDAKKLCSNLKIRCVSLNADAIVGPTIKALGLKYDKKNITFEEQSIQSRARGQLLMAYGARHNALVLAAGNKTDLAVGYFSSYGEAAGTLAPLADLWKTQVKSMADFLNVLHKRKHKSLVIPKSIIEKEPSAELRPKQKDTDDLPAYDVLDKVLQFYVVHKKDIHQIARLGFDAELVRRVAYLVSKNEFKRYQTALPLRISSSSFGSNWQYPVVSGWRG